MGSNAHQNAVHSAKTAGEIDGRVPFESVKAAVSLFGGPAFSSSTQAQKELKELQEKLKNAETTRIQALSELEQAKKTVKDLREEQKAIGESKESAREAAEKFRAAEKRENILPLAFDGARDLLQRIAEEEKSLKTQMEFLSLELENVKREKAKLKMKEIETDALVAELKTKLQSSKADLAAITSKEPRAQAACDRLISTFKLLAVESANARERSETMKKTSDELAREVDALRQLTFLYDKRQAAREESMCGTHISISTATKAEAIRASEEGTTRLEALKREIEETKQVREDTLKAVEMAEAGRRAAEGEMRRLSEVACMKLAEHQLSKVPSPPRTRVRRSDQQQARRTFRKPGRVSRSLWKGGSLSYLPGETPL